MKTNWVSWYIDPRIFFISALDGGVWSAYDPAALPPEKEPPVAFGMRLVEPQSRSGRGVGEKDSQPLPGLEPR
jgi:hypothetical protein